MINTSNEYRSLIFEERTLYHQAIIILGNGTVLTVDDSQLAEGGIKIEDGVSSSGKLDIGSAIINKATIILNNFYDEFSDYDFLDAQVRLRIGLRLSETIEWMDKGIYIVDEPTFTDGQITLSCLDNMHKFERTYDSKLAYPTTLAMIFRDACQKCGVDYYTTGFRNNNYTVQKKPEDTNLTYREMILYVSQLAAGFARCNNKGQLEIRSFDFSVFTEADYDGGTLNLKNEGSSRYEDGDVLEGGTFSDYSSGAAVDGGNFERRGYHVIGNLSSASIATDDILVTGVQVTEEFPEKEEEKDENGHVTAAAKKKQTSLFGTAGYVLELSGNPLIQENSAFEVAKMIGAYVVGMKFRPMTVQGLSDPAIEAGDMAMIVDRKGSAYQGPISNLSYQSGNLESFSADAETLVERRAKRNTSLSKEITRAIQEEQQKREQDKTFYEEKLERLSDTMANASGLYSTKEVQDDGSTIFYMHDKPTLSESMIVWKMTREAFAVSTDGGKTWNAGITINGEVIASILTAIGINAEWITTGILQDKTGANQWNLNSGSLTMSGRFKSGTTNNLIDVNNGRIYGYEAGEQIGYVDFSARTTNQTTGEKHRGVKIYGDVIYLQPNVLVVSGQEVATGSVTYLKDVSIDGNKVTKTFGTFRYTKGMIYTS